ncbi:LacI family transcriptional regulator [Sphingomonas oleivorans]|uniref:LacI family transcriptional regulator n=1 Tax=Sphingomonas oleivorans TaxID=1735121 RepID=A0A2T5FTL7_9SPHN|nr:LacI family DNA-binding transcriptional regulator [Sphingomonas oleivorans]PTQ07417.1 LacI family transcriptional regulator [Sphingomonas oleivorans]
MSKSTRLEDLAALAGVSISTVSRALNDSPAVNLRTKQAIWKLAREHDYPFRRYMPAGPIGADATIAIVVPRPQGREGRLSDPFFLELLAGVGEAARERGCDVLVSHVAPANIEDLSVLTSTSRADGIIFLGQSSLHHEFNLLAEQDARFVVWGAQLPEQAYCSIGSDNLLGGRRATLHLARLGRRRIVFLGDTEAPESMQRHRGYLDGLTQAGLDPDPGLSVPAHFDVEGAEAAVDRLIARRIDFDGIVAASDLIALGAIRALLRAGRSVPGDISVVGYDDVPFARYNHPALSTISQDTAKAGRLLVSKLLLAREGGDIRSERVPTDLIVRESCGG